MKKLIMSVLAVLAMGILTSCEDNGQYDGDVPIVRLSTWSDVNLMWNYTSEIGKTLETCEMYESVKWTSIVKPNGASYAMATCKFKPGVHFVDEASEETLKITDHDYHEYRFSIDSGVVVNLDAVTTHRKIVANPKGSEALRIQYAMLMPKVAENMEAPLKRDGNVHRVENTWWMTDEEIVFLLDSIAR